MRESVLGPPTEATEDIAKARPLVGALHFSPVLASALEVVLLCEFNYRSLKANCQAERAPPLVSVWFRSYISHRSLLQVIVQNYVLAVQHSYIAAVNVPDVL